MIHHIPNELNYDLIIKHKHIYFNTFYTYSKPASEIIKSTTTQIKKYNCKSHNNLAQSYTICLHKKKGFKKYNYTNNKIRFKGGEL